MSAFQKRVSLPNYSLGEEVFNSISHGIGALAGIIGIILMDIRATGPQAMTCSSVFGVSIIVAYAVSCVYHALPARLEGKRVLRVIDHCTVFLLVFGTYVPAALLGVCGILGWVLFAVVLFFTVIGITLTAIDVDRYSKVAMACHLVNGWSFVVGLPQLYASFGFTCAALVVGGGVAYTLGAILYGLGRDHANMHCVFHVFCLVGTFCHFLAVFAFLL